MKLLLLVALAAAAPAAMAQMQVEISKVDKDGVGESIGTISFSDSEYGLLIDPDLSGLPPGPHGMHVHANPHCEPGESEGQIVPAGSAGGHFDPEETGTHQGPYDDTGHLGDLPVLIVDEQGNATTPVVAPRLEPDDLNGHSIIIHQGGDTYSDEPKLGGAGPRIACGIVSESETQ
jgi:Cu-Zn family superoxide dismutase